MAKLEIIIGGAADPSGRRGSSHRQEADRGQLVRLAPGRFVRADPWRAANPGERHIARIKALHDRIHPRLVVSHASAAALHGLPWSGEFPEIVDTLDPARSTTQTLRGIRKRPGATRRLRTAVMTANGRSLTDLVSTGVDLAISYPMRLSVPALDVALQIGATTEAMREELGTRGAVHGRHRAERAIEFADARSGSPGESIARVALDEVGAPTPVLQQRFEDDRGAVGIVDFWFPEEGAVLEFDGRVKYVDPAMRRAGQSAADVLVAEKHREDRLRRHPMISTVGRIGSHETSDSEALRDVLRSLGIPTARRRFMHVR